MSGIQAGNQSSRCRVRFLDTQQEAALDRIKILNQALWKEVPKDVITEAEHAAKESPVWIARQSNGHIVAMDGPGDPDVATGDVMFIAEVAPKSPSA